MNEIDILNKLEKKDINKDKLAEKYPWLIEPLSKFIRDARIEAIKYTIKINEIEELKQSVYKLAELELIEKNEVQTIIDGINSIEEDD